MTEYEVYTAYCLIANENDPHNFKEAIKEEQWSNAIQKEIESHKKLQTWTETVLPQGKKAIETKWVFRTKEDGTKKARIVAKGFQIKEENFSQAMYAPVARISTIRVMLSVSLQKNYEIRQLDIPTAFLNGELNSEVYIKPPEGLKTKSQVLKLNRALYGLKESPRVWNDTFSNFAIKNKLKRSRFDCCLYYNKDIWLLLYVDDILITGEKDKIRNISLLLQEYFKAKNLGEIKEFLGMSIVREEQTLYINQTKFIEKLLKYYNMQDCKGKSTPMEKGFQFNKDNEIIDVPYRQLIGSLMYVSTISCPDITYAVSYLSRFLDTPTQETWNASKRILRYLKETKEKRLVFKKNDIQDRTINAFSDSDWGADKTDRKNVSGSIIMYGQNVISWFSKKQNWVA